MMRRNRKPQTTAEQSNESDNALDLDSLALPDRDEAALKSLAALQDEVRAPIITPAQERFPSINPQLADPPKPAPPPKPKPKYLLNSVTIVALLATGGLIAWIAAIWVNPAGSVNPFPPSTPFVQITATPLGFIAPDLPTPNASGQIIVIATETPRPTIASASVNDGPVYPFALVEIGYIANGNGLGCSWSSIAGSVTDAVGNGLAGYRVRVTGSGLNETVFSNTAPTFGPGGFELPLDNAPEETEYTLQLADAQGNLLSEQFTLTTRNDCEGNVVVANFTQN